MTKKQHVTKSGDTFEWEETDEVREAKKLKKIHATNRLIMGRNDIRRLGYS